MSVKGSVACAYLLWLETQGGAVQASAGREREPRGWLMQIPELWQRRAPGTTCLRALESMCTPGEPARNDRKGCGGVMRAAPVGLAAQQIRGESRGEWAFARGVEIAALTHGHPTGQLPAGVLAMAVARLCEGASLQRAIADATVVLASWPDHRETLLAIEHAQRLATQAVPPDDAIGDLGEGWVAEEALAIAVYCALVAKDFTHGVLLAVNHGGDSDSTGAIAGNLLGACLGMGAIPLRWQETVELSNVLIEIADDLEACGRWPIGPYASHSDEVERLIRKYPA
jgi:ADP-ribosylglycohydrolase